jgi:hypothetical protein
LDGVDVGSTTELDDNDDEGSVPLLGLQRRVLPRLARWWATGTMAGAASASAAGARATMAWWTAMLRAMCGVETAAAERARERTAQTFGKNIAMCGEKEGIGSASGGAERGKDSGDALLLNESGGRGVGRRTLEYVGTGKGLSGSRNSDNVAGT